MDETTAIQAIDFLSIAQDELARGNTETAKGFVADTCELLQDSVDE